MAITAFTPVNYFQILNKYIRYSLQLDFNVQVRPLEAETAAVLYPFLLRVIKWLIMLAVSSQRWGEMQHLTKIRNQFLLFFLIGLHLGRVILHSAHSGSPCRPESKCEREREGEITKKKKRQWEWERIWRFESQDKLRKSMRGEWISNSILHPSVMAAEVPWSKALLMEFTATLAAKAVLRHMVLWANANFSMLL